MRTPAWFVIAVALVFQGGCRSSDWIERTLVTVDVTGVWEGSYSGTHFSQDVVLVLQQQGQRVIGEVSGLKVPGGSMFTGSIPIDGTVNGDMFSFKEASGLQRVRGELHVNGDEMTGSAEAGAYSSIKMNARRRPQ